MKSRAELKSYFETGDRPTQQEYDDLITTLATQSGSNTFSADLQTFLGEISCAAVSATSFYGDGGNLTGVNSLIPGVNNYLPYDYIVTANMPTFPANTARTVHSFSLGNIGNPDSIYWTFMIGYNNLDINYYRNNAGLMSASSLESGLTASARPAFRAIDPGSATTSSAWHQMFVIKNYITNLGRYILRAYGGTDGYLQATRFCAPNPTGNTAEKYSADNNATSSFFPDDINHPITYQNLQVGVLAGFYAQSGAGGPFSISSNFRYQIESFWLNNTDPLDTKLEIAFNGFNSVDIQFSPSDFMIGIILP